MKRMKHLFVLTTALVAVGFENKSGWKKDDAGNLVTDDSGNPIMIDDKGAETALAPGYIQRINGEAATHRRAAKEANDKLAKFGDLDPDAARAAIEKTKDINLDDLVNKGEIEKVRATVLAEADKRIKDAEDKAAAASQRADALALENAFGSSKFLNERVAVPVDATKAAFQNRFKVEDGKVVPLGDSGEPLYNGRGEIASIDEAFETFINQRADKDVWLKAVPAGGSGSQGGGGGRGGGNTIKRSDFDALPPGEQAAVGAKAAKGEVSIVD